jgi:hypothetical protein
MFLNQYAHGELFGHGSESTFHPISSLNTKFYIVYLTDNPIATGTFWAEVS